MPALAAERKQVVNALNGARDTRETMMTAIWMIVLLIAAPVLWVLRVRRPSDEENHR